MIAAALPWGRIIALAAIALAVGVGLLYVGHLKNTIAGQRLVIEARDNIIKRLGAELAATADAAEANRLALLQQRLAHDAKLVALEQERAAAQAAESIRTTIKLEVARAPTSDDAPIAPLLSRALDRLRAAGSGSAARGGADGTDQDQGSGQPAALPAGAAGP